MACAFSCQVGLKVNIRLEVAVSPGMGSITLGLLVDDRDSAAVDLRAQGVEFICEPWEIRPGVKIAVVKGPDHISIELAQRNE